MLPDGSIAANNLWKRFRPDKRRRLLRDRAGQLLHVARGRQPEWQWALLDVTFEAEPGEAVGLIGANGSGKSTLLKILSGVMYPYAGRVATAGRVGAMIEVRAGIHPDLTGRENVYLYGSLLGLGRRTVSERFDQIVAFADLDEAIDRQVKFYSSGMQMRIGFAVAAFLEPDILLVDEVLAVGDASFQQRCLDRMRTVLSQGTTLVFVSHDLAAVEATCPRAVWLHNGLVEADGRVQDVMQDYRSAIEQQAEASSHVGGVLQLRKAEVSGANGSPPTTQEALQIRMRLESQETTDGRLFLGVSEGPAPPIFLLGRDMNFRAEEIAVNCSLPRLPLPRGRYYVWLGVFGRNRRELLPWHPACQFEVAGPSLDGAPTGIVRLSRVHVESDWDVERV
jgi:ABC-type polysaccharide/polyol phosphate transport system ATPase subunit